MLKFCALSGMGCLALCLQAQAQEADWAALAELPPATATADLVAGATPARLGAALAGAWRGSLTYRDYGSDKRVVLPTSASVTVAADATLEVGFIYDDGPGKTVRSNDTWALSADGRSLRMKRDQLDVSDYRAGTGADLLLVVLGTGTENGTPVQVRMVVLRRGDALTISRATQQPDQAWLLRHRYAFTLERPGASDR